MRARSRSIGKVIVALAGIAASGVFAGSAEASVLASSSFDSDTEGWKVVGDTQTATEEPTFVPTGGNPGGYISIDDAATGGVMFWRAPKSFRKKADKAYEGSLRYSLRQSDDSDQFVNRDIMIEGDGLRLTYDDDVPNPSLPPDWTEYKVKLTKTGWVDETGDPEPATAKDMKTVLKSLDLLLIRAEYHTGPEFDDLDSVSLKAPKD